MKKIGFIDYYLDEWHANKYPDWIKETSGGEMTVAYAYGKRDADNGLDNAAWCREKGIQLMDNIESVVEASDYLIVLSPDHPEQHEELCRLPLQSGKPTYVDKTFAPDRATAERLFQWAADSGTPLFSSSALRFAAEADAVKREGIDAIVTIGPGQYANYSIHQVEQIVALMGSEAERVMWTGTDATPALHIGFSGGRFASIHHFHDSAFQTSVNYAAGESASYKVESNFFGSFISSMVDFFRSGQPPVPQEETMAIITVIEYGHNAVKTPHQWLELPRG